MFHRLLKKLDLLIIKAFIGPFVATFFVTLFVLVLQFMWLYIDDVVGKGVDTYDLHATVLNLMGLDHLKVTYLNNGRSERPTVVYGEVVKELIA